MKIMRAFTSAVLLLVTAAAVMSCGEKMTTPSSACTMGPYTFDANVQRCRASNGQFAESVCCGR